MSADRFAAARAVADAVLYEGYVLYPYRASARKNQLRWQFGVLVPQRQAQFDDSERWSLRTECIVDPGSSPRLHVRVRCLQVQHRRIEEAIDGGRFSPTESLSVDDATWVEWDEAVEHELTIAELDLLPTADAGREVPVHLPAGETVDVLATRAGELAGRAVRTRQAVDGRGARRDTLGRRPRGVPRCRRQRRERHRLVRSGRDDATTSPATRSSPCTPCSPSTTARSCRCSSHRTAPLRQSPVAATTARSPSLVGPHGDVVLSSPIILYDQPEIAPESVGDLFDATEIDEILGLRVLTLTDEEKAEARGTDARAAEIIDRFDDLPPEVWARLHGAVRSIVPTAAAEPEPTPWWDPDADAAIDPWTESVVIAGVEVAAGTKVVLRPGHRRAGRPRHLPRRDDGHRRRRVQRCRGSTAHRRDRGRRPGDRGAGVAGSLPVLPPRRDRGGIERGPMRALVAGIGNIFFADDGFGVEVARRLDGREVPAGVQVADFGIRGVHLAYELLDGYDLLVLVDAMPLGEPPGTVAVVEVESDGAEPSGGLDAHTMTPATVLANLERLGGHVERIVVVACQPAAIEEGIGLSPAVAAAVDGAADLVLDVLNDSLVNGREPRWA